MSKLYVFFQEVKVIFAVLLQIAVLMRLHGAEALSAASNIFLDVGPAFFTFAPDAGRMNRPGRYFMLRLGD
ncbi:MAG TPA: hypothetical protein VJ969_02910, partial [Desulfopila sp.]|nr:hypothetical protein [Desulfopila sp.]